MFPFLILETEFKAGQSCEGMQKLLELFGYYSNIVDKIASLRWWGSYSHCSAKCQIDILAEWAVATWTWT